MREYEKLAKLLVEYSCEVKKGEKVLIDQIAIDPVFIAVLIKEIKKAGGYPFVINDDPTISKALLIGETEEYAKLKTKYLLPIMKDMDAYIGLRASDNAYEMSDVDSEFVKNDNLYFSEPVHIQERVNNTKWVILRWPSGSFAQNANMSTEAFTKMYFDVCTLDYKKMSDAMNPLLALLEKTDKVRILGPNTDLTFSIKNIPGKKCCGKRNVPDGEVYTAPLKYSVNGRINYNIPTLYQGVKFENICLDIKDGKIINATCNGDVAKLNNILDTDEGARYFGEFALGVNPLITKPMLSILFDEKITGSIHLTPGCCYKEASNGNESAVHWDMVMCHLPEYGGGEIWFDDVLVRKDGLFVLDELKPLNPENLM